MPGTPGAVRSLPSTISVSPSSGPQGEESAEVHQRSTGVTVIRICNNPSSAANRYSHRPAVRSGDGRLADRLIGG